MPRTCKNTIAIVCLSLLFISTVSSQLEDSEFYYGFHAGVTHSSIDEVHTTLIRPIFDVNTYSTESVPLIGFTTGASIFYRFRKSKFAIQPEIVYADLGGQFRYEDINDLQYDIIFSYNYISIAPKVKYYLANGINLSFAPQLCLAINQNRLTYISNKPEYGPDLQIEQSLSQVLKANSIAAFSAGIGYDLPFGLSVQVEYLLGVSDAIETLANGFYFIENRNQTTAVKATVGYFIPFYN